MDLLRDLKHTGQISLISLTKIAMALDIADELEKSFYTGTIQGYSGGYQ